MKKIFILLLTILSINIGFSQNDSIPKITETERIIDKYGGVIIDGFNKTVEQVTPVAEEGFRIAVKLQIAKGVVGILPPFIFIIFAILFVRQYKIEDDFSYNPTVLAIAYFIGTFLFFITSCFTINTGITHLIAPEWFAIKEIINLVK